MSTPTPAPTPAHDEPPTVGAAVCPPGSRFPLLPGVRSRIVPTARLAQHVYESGPADGEPVVLIHGNASSARFFETLMAALPEYAIIAPDLRGYGASEALVIDATRGVSDLSDDLHALVETLGLARFHLLGWSLGGNIVMQYTIDHPDRVHTLTLHSGGSPFGYGGTQGIFGQPNYPDFAGSGGGLISPEVRARYEAHDTTADSPFSPRAALRQLIVKPTFSVAPEREDVLVEQMLLMRIGDEYYPGDGVPSENWPYAGPGIYGANNALSPKYLNQSTFSDIHGGPQVLWMRGADDLLVGDAALVDPAVLGQMGVIPGWPGDDICPPQPMVAQLRSVLDGYVANGGRYREVVLPDCAHAPLLEQPDAFREHFVALLRERSLHAPSAPPAPPAPPAPTVAPAPSTPAAASAPATPTPPTEPPTRKRGGFLDLLRRRRYPGDV